MQGSENDRLRLFEVTFRHTISGTILVLAADEAKATEKVKAQIKEDLDTYDEMDVLWNEDDRPAIKDDLTSSLELSKPSMSTYDPVTAGRSDEFNPDELAQWEPGFGAPSADPGPKQGDDKPFDEDHDGIDKPGDDRLVGGNDAASRDARLTAHQTSSTSLPNREGPLDSKTVKGDTPSANPEQRTGAPTTATTSAGAVAPNVNRGAPTAPPRPAPAKPNPQHPVGTVPIKK